VWDMNLSQFLEMQLVNTVLRGQLDPQLFPFSPTEHILRWGDIVFTKRMKIPTMYTGKIPGVGTVLLFSSHKWRAMGKNMSECWVRENLPILGLVHVQTRTWTFQLGYTLHLAKIHHSISGKVHCHESCIQESVYEPELFGSRLIRIKQGGAINVFASGKLILLGAGTRSENEWMDIIRTLFL